MINLATNNKLPASCSVLISVFCASARRDTTSAVLTITGSCIIGLVFSVLMDELFSSRIDGYLKY